MLFIHGILVPIYSEGESGNIHKILLDHDLKNKWLMLVGDSLTQMRIKYFADKFKKSCYDFSDQ